MKVATIIVNYNDYEDTIKYVETIKDYSIIDRIVVVDNKSTREDTMEKLSRIKNEKVKVIQAEQNGGYDYGNNYGINFLKKEDEPYDYYIISNPDIMVTEEAIRNTIKVLEENDDVAVCAPRMFNKDGKPIRRSAWKKRTFLLDCVHATRLLELIFYKVLRGGEYLEKDYENEKLEVEAISGAFFIIKANILHKIGLLDENVFLFYEEDILAKLLEKENMKTISLNSEKFIHFESQTIGKTFSYFRKMRQMFKSKMYYHKKYNKINIIQTIIFYILYLFRNIELLIEIPVRKLLKK